MFKVIQFLILLISFSVNNIPTVAHFVSTSLPVTHFITSFSSNLENIVETLVAQDVCGLIHGGDQNEMIIGAICCTLWVAIIWSCVN